MEHETKVLGIGLGFLWCMIALVGYFLQTPLIYYVLILLLDEVWFLAVILYREWVYV